MELSPTSNIHRGETNTMLIKRFFYNLCALAGLVSTNALAGNDTLADLNWLEGRWLEQRDNGTIVEVMWNPAIGNAMTGTWSQSVDDGLKRYEILTMREIDGEVFYRFDLFEKGEDELFTLASMLRLKLIKVSEPIATFEIVGEENWVLTMDASDGILRGWIVDTEKPSSKNK